MHLARGYSLVFTPHVMRARACGRLSGHEGFYSQNMFTPMELDDAEYRHEADELSGPYFDL